MPYPNNSPQSNSNDIVADICLTLEGEVESLQLVSQLVAELSDETLDTDVRTDRTAKLRAAVSQMNQLGEKSASQLAAYNANNQSQPTCIVELQERKRTAMLAANDGLKAATESLQLRKEQVIRDMVSENQQQRMRTAYRS